MRVLLVVSAPASGCFILRQIVGKENLAFSINPGPGFRTRVFVCLKNYPLDRPSLIRQKR
jgi:hypothetical protein